jgi:3-hydroxybutyryl-CoA dehydrogenase
MSQTQQLHPRVAVLGAGIMGGGIAQLAAMAGHEVVSRDVSEEQLERARGVVSTSLARFVKAGRINAEEATAVQGRLSFSADLDAAVGDAEIVIEAVPEVLELKQEVLAEVLDRVSADAFIGTNTSQLSITEIASSLGENAPRLVGVHFFNPPVMMRLVELIPGMLTTDAELERARDFALGLDREVVVCRKDSPGFITSRAYSALRLECVRMLEEGLANSEEIDKAMRLAFNFPMGPFELGDMNGIDTNLHVLEGLNKAHGERFRPTVGLRNLVAANRLGRKTGAGFYDYTADGRKVPSDSALDPR